MEKLKMVIVGAIGALTSFLGILAIPVYLLVGCNTLDIMTGAIACKNRGEKLNSGKLFKGITKKVCQWLLILIGAWLDILIRYAVVNAGIPWNFPFLVSIIVAVWLVVNEMLSILENLVDIGVQLPPFLRPIIKRIKNEVEEVGNQAAEEDPDDKTE